MMSCNMSYLQKEMVDEITGYCGLIVVTNV